ncbi:TolB-like protein [Rhizobium mesoamericanum]|uniref:adenylate cyclase n=1 Tax=Rhizobium mesoamericanum TaxID=1079800 RepID=UPI00277D4DA3|nr:TolB-like protein [Rhizobium mesoamericanum]
MQNELPPESEGVWRAAPTPDDIRAQLNVITSSPEFPTVGRSAAFLKYVTEEALAGRADRIKGYSIAVEVFKRSEGFSQDDPVVRIEAGRLRRLLERYYLVAGQYDPIRIDIPKGGYAPSFEWTDTFEGSPAEETKTPAPRGFRVQLPRLMAVAIGVGATLGIGIGALALFAHLLPGRSNALLSEGGPTLVVAPFADLGDGPQAQLYSAGLTEELLTVLPRFKEIQVFGRETSKSLSPGVPASQVRHELGARFLLAGGVRVSGNRVRVTARLVDTETDRILWSNTYDDDTHIRDLFSIQSDVANKVATAVAQPYGIMAQADAVNPPPDDVGAYTCALGFYAYRAQLAVDQHANVRNCLERAVERYPSFATGWAMLSLVYLDEERFRFNARPGTPTPVERSLSTARRAVQLDAGNTRALQALMTALFFSQKVDEALKVGEEALETNPNDTELLGDFGTRVAQSGQWERGAALLDRATELNPAGGGYYHGMRAFAAYMLHDRRTALVEISQADLQKFPLYHAVAAVIYADADMMDDARREAKRFNEMRPDFIPNIVAELKSRNFRPADRAKLIADIRKAGLPAVDEVEASMVLPTDSSAPSQPR